MRSALSKLTLPPGKSCSFPKKEDRTFFTVKGFTCHVEGLSSSPSKALLFGEKPIAPFLKKAEAVERSPKTEFLLRLSDSLAST